MIYFILILLGIEILCIFYTGIKEKKLWKVIKSCFLCTIFPFLYQRNRFTGLHYNNWTITDFHRRNYKNCFQDFWIYFKTNENPDDYYNYRTIGLDHYIIFLDKGIFSIENSITKKTIYSYDLGKLKDKIIKIGFKRNGPDNKIYILSSEEIEPPENFNRLITVKTNPILLWIIKILDFINSWILQVFHHIPVYTELDALEEGWMKNFGYKICWEIWWELLKHGPKTLYKYRITQIKEKYGSLCWYDNFSTPGIQRIIRKYEKISTEICIKCGKPAYWRTDGYINFLCNEHISEEDKKYADRILQESEKENYIEYEGKIYPKLIPDEIEYYKTLDELGELDKLDENNKIYQYKEMTKKSYPTH